MSGTEWRRWEELRQQIWRVIARADEVRRESEQMRHQAERSLQRLLSDEGTQDVDSDEVHGRVRDRVIRRP